MQETGGVPAFDNDAILIDDAIMTWPGFGFLLTQVQVSVFRWAGRQAAVNYFSFERRTGSPLVPLTLWVIRYTVTVAKQTSISSAENVLQKTKKESRSHIWRHINSVACISKKCTLRKEICIERAICYGDAEGRQEATSTKITKHTTTQFLSVISVILTSWYN